MSSRYNNQLEISKTRNGNRICLEVPQRKLGAVLCAIGSALDGHPWEPYCAVKRKSRGCRGGKANRERGTQAAVHKSGTVCGVSSATNQSSLQEDVVVCPKRSTKPHVMEPMMFGTIPSNGMPKKASEAASNSAKASQCRTTPKDCSSSGSNNAPIPPPSTHEGSSVNDRQKQDPSRKSGGSRAPRGSSNADPPTREVSLEEKTGDPVTKLQDKAMYRLKVVAALQHAISIHKRTPMRVIKPIVVQEPKQEDYGWFKKSDKQFAIDYAKFEEYCAQHRQRINALAYNDATSIYNSTYHTTNHYLNCNDACLCDTRKDPRYITLLNEWHGIVNTTIMDEKSGDDDLSSASGDNHPPKTGRSQPRRSRR